MFFPLPPEPSVAHADAAFSARVAKGSCGMEGVPRAAMAKL